MGWFSALAAGGLAPAPQAAPTPLAIIDPKTKLPIRPSNAPPAGAPVPALAAAAAPPAAAAAPGDAVTHLASIQAPTDTLGMRELMMKHLASKRKAAAPAADAAAPVPAPAAADHKGTLAVSLSFASMATVVAATPTACSKCERPFSTDEGRQLAGVCSTCADGESLCQKCVARHAVEARFAGHSCRSLGDVYAGADFLERLGLEPAPKACPRHAQPFLDVRCGECSTASAVTSFTVGLCAACVNEHARAQPSHVLALYSPDVTAMREQLVSLASLSVATSVESEITAGGSSSRSIQAVLQTSPLVETARRKAAAVQTELDALAVHMETSLAQLEANRDAVVASAHACFRAGVDAVTATAAAKQAALEGELEVADAALQTAINTTTALVEVCLWGSY